MWIYVKNCIFMLKDTKELPATTLSYRKRDKMGDFADIKYL